MRLAREMQLLEYRLQPRKVNRPTGAGGIPSARHGDQENKQTQEIDAMARRGGNDNSRSGGVNTGRQSGKSGGDASARGGSGGSGGGGRMGGGGRGGSAGGAGGGQRGGNASDNTSIGNINISS